MSYTESNKMAMIKNCMTAVPRGGGYVAYLLPPDGAKDGSTVKNIMSPVSCPCSPLCNVMNPAGSAKGMAATSSNSTTREYRVNKAVELEWDMSSINSDEIDECPHMAHDLKSTISLLPLLISTVMLLAAGKDVPPDQLDTTAAFLECITNDENIPPPNIQGIMNIIAGKTGRKQSPYSTHNKFPTTTVLTATK